MASYTLNLWSNPGQGGEVSFDGQNWQQDASQTSSNPTTFTCYARANAGWRFVRWYKPNQWSRTENPTSIYVDEGSVDVYAIFEQATPTTYTIATAVSPAGGGTTTGDGTYAAGASCTITATPAAGYVFLRWEKNGVQVSTAQNYVFVVDESATYTAVFASGAVTITLYAHNNWGKVAFSGETPSTSRVSKTVSVGSSVTIEAARVGSATPIFSYWDGPGGRNPNTPRTITATATATYTAYFYAVVRAFAAQVSDPTTPLNIGQVRILADGGTTGWWHTTNRQVVDSITVTIEQRSLGGGWAFVKWRYKRTYGTSWSESTSATLTVTTDFLEIYALFERTPTHLPVTTFNRSTPVRILYDDRPGGTGLIVADF